MGERCLLLHIIFVLGTCFYFHSALCRSISSESDSSEQYTTTVLDVAASIQRARDVLSFHPQTALMQVEKRPNITKPYSSSSSFSLPLHPRSSLHKHHYKDYKDLVHARLDRDCARVKFLSTKHELALNGSEIESVELDDVQIPMVTNELTGEYFAQVGVGQPVREYLMMVDTGSDVTWLQCKPCGTCYNQSVPIFDPFASSTYHRLSCDSPQCKALQPPPSCEFKHNSSCPYQAYYNDHSTSTGSLVTETLSFAKSGSVMNDFLMGCGYENKKFTDTSGLLGLGPGPLSLTSQLKARSFSYCLVDRDSSKSSTLEFNSARPGDSVTTKLLRNPKFPNSHFYVGLTGISVGGQPLNISQSLFQIDQENGDGGVIVDSGTTVTWLKPEAYQALRDTFVRMMTTRGMPSISGESGILDTCYNVPSFKIADVPTISFQFSDGQTLMLPAENYMIQAESGEGKTKFCLAFTRSKAPFSIMGNVQQQGMRVSFDLDNSIVGFSPNKC